MRIRIYKVNRDLPEYMTFDVLECNRIWDIPPGIYKESKTEEVDYRTIDELFDAIENKELDNLELEKSDIIEVVPDLETVRSENDCRFIVITALGCEIIALEKEKVFTEISLDAMREMITVE